MNFKFFVILVIFFNAFLNVKAQYQEQSLKAPAKKSFQLNASQSETSFKPSNIGIIGMKYLHQKGSMSTVIEVYPNTPAAQAGVQVGDRLIEIDGTNIMPFNSDQVFAMIAGLPGSPIHLKFMRCNIQGSGCYSFENDLIRMDMNQLHSDRVFKIYKYGS